MNGSLNDGIHGATVYILKIIISILALSISVCLIIGAYLDFSIDIVGLTVKLLSCVVFLIPLAALALAANYCPAGSFDRMIIRLLSNILLCVCLLTLIHNISYEMGSIVMGEMTAKDTTVSIEFSKICYIFLLVPLFSSLDAITEYREGRRKS